MSLPYLQRAKKVKSFTSISGTARLAIWTVPRSRKTINIASGFSETNRVREAQQLGAGEYIRKPYTFQKIGEAGQNQFPLDFQWRPDFLPYALRPTPYATQQLPLESIAQLQ
ncbi:MAG: hypothetical protein GY697_09310 [Desulfobacterales bacterium]|nr:hypothetical protein [Desulfobacterales bacterium]